MKQYQGLGRPSAQSEAPCGHIQLHLPMFPPHVIKAVEEHLARRADVRERRHQAYLVRLARARRAAIAAIAPIALEAPLIDSGAPNELDCRADPQNGGDDLPPDSNGGDGVTTQWSDAAIQQLHEGILHQTLKVFKARGNAAEKRDALLWIFAPQRYEASLSIGGVQQWHVLPPKLTPFSFEMCCAICGYRPEMLTEPLKAMLLDGLGLGELFSEITHATTGSDQAGDEYAGNDDEPAPSAGQEAREDFDARGLWPHVDQPASVGIGPGTGPGECPGQGPGLHLRRTHAAPAADVLA